jgi:hypothetical protein
MTNCKKAMVKSCGTKKVRRSTAMLTKQIPSMGEAVVRVAKVLNGEIKQPKTFDQNGIYCLQSESEHLLYGGKSRNVGQRFKSHNYTDFKGIEHDGMLICSCKRDWDTTFMNANEKQYIQAIQIYAAMFGYTVTNKNKIYKGALNDLLKPSDWEVINAYLESHKVA